MIKVDIMKIQMTSFDRCVTIEVDDYDKYEEIFKKFKSWDKNADITNNR